MSPAPAGAAGEPTALPLRCGVCCAPLTDAHTLFTSCGHIFCLSSSCTTLKRDERGVCEQCGHTCDAVVPSTRAERYEPRVGAMLFDDVADRILQVLELQRFRARHNDILLRNVDALRERLRTAKRRLAARDEENGRLREQLATLTARNRALQARMTEDRREALLQRESLPQRERRLSRAPTVEAEGLLSTPAARAEPAARQQYRNKLSAPAQQQWRSRLSAPTLAQPRRSLARWPDAARVEKRRRTTTATRRERRASYGSERVPRRMGAR